MSWRVLTPSGASKCLYRVPRAITGSQRHGTGCWYQPNFHRTKYMASLGDPVPSNQSIVFHRWNWIQYYIYESHFQKVFTRNTTAKITADHKQPLMNNSTKRTSHLIFITSFNRNYILMSKFDLHMFSLVFLSKAEKTVEQ